MLNRIVDNTINNEKMNESNSFDNSSASSEKTHHRHERIDKPTRRYSGKDALLSSNWLAYQHSMDHNDEDLIEDSQDQISLTELNKITSQITPMDLLFDVSIESDTLPTRDSENLHVTTDNTIDHANLSTTPNTFLKMNSKSSNEVDICENINRQLFDNNITSSSLIINSKQMKDDLLINDEPLNYSNESENKNDSNYIKEKEYLNEKQINQFDKCSKIFSQIEQQTTSFNKSIEKNQQISFDVSTIESCQLNSNQNQCIKPFEDYKNNKIKGNSPIKLSKCTSESKIDIDYYIQEPDDNDRAPLEAYNEDINDLQLQQLNGWLLQICLPFQNKNFYKNKLSMFNEKRYWQEFYVRVFFDENKLRLYYPQNIERTFAEIQLQKFYQVTKFNLQQYDQFSKIHTFSIYESIHHNSMPSISIDRLMTIPEQFIRRITQPNQTQQNTFDRTNFMQNEIVKVGHLNYKYLKRFSIILDDLLWSMPVAYLPVEKHLKEEIIVEIFDQYFAHIDANQCICKHKSRTRLFLLSFMNDSQTIIEIGMNDWFRHGKEINKRQDIIINETLKEYWIKPEQVELSSVIDSNEYESTRLIRLKPLDGQNIEIVRFRTRPKQNLELPLKIFCSMSVINRQVNIQIGITISNSRDEIDNQLCLCEDIQICFPIPDGWSFVFRTEKGLYYTAMHSVRRTAERIKGLDNFMTFHQDNMIPSMSATIGTAIYEHAFSSIVWRIDQLSNRDQSAYNTHLFECKFLIPTFSPIPEQYEPIANAEYFMSRTFISHCQIRSVSIQSNEDVLPPEKTIRSKCQFNYAVNIAYAFEKEKELVSIK